MSPEMLKGTGHDRRVDIYCMGALLYEMLTGLPPFYNKDTNHMYDAILKKDNSYPYYISEEVKNLMSHLLEKDPDSRMQSISEVKKHSWLKDVNWDKLQAKAVPPPILPTLYESHIDPEY
jgi:serine/threonine protein kinase